MTRSYTIALDGSTYQGMVEVLRDSQVVAERSLGGEAAGSGKREAGRGDALMPAIAECLKEAGVKREDIARIVCGAGPGSFTSLRVAGSVAKGLGGGYGVGLFGVFALVLALPAGEYLSVLDAMRGEYFAARVTLLPDQTVIQSQTTTLISAAELAELA